jgi:hypothetical protein
MLSDSQTTLKDEFNVSAQSQLTLKIRSGLELSNAIDSYSPVFCIWMLAIRSLCKVV